MVSFVLYNLGDQKKYLPFHMGRYGSPALLIAVDRLNRRSQKLGHLPLGLFQFFPEMFEFRAVHMSSQVEILTFYETIDVKDQYLSATWWHRLSRKIQKVLRFYDTFAVPAERDSPKADKPSLF